MIKSITAAAEVAAKVKVVLFARGVEPCEIKSQLQRLRQHAATLEKAEVCAEFAVTGQSGSAGATEAKRQVTELAAAGQCEIVLVTTADRWTRSVVEFGEAKSDLARHGCRMVTLADSAQPPRRPWAKAPLQGRGGVRVQRGKRRLVTSRKATLGSLTVAEPPSNSDRKKPSKKAEGGSTRPPKKGVACHTNTLPLFLVD